MGTLHAVRVAHRNLKRTKMVTALTLLRGGVEPMVVHADNCGCKASRRGKTPTKLGQNSYAQRQVYRGVSSSVAMVEKTFTVGGTHRGTTSTTLRSVAASLLNTCPHVSRTGLCKVTWRLSNHCTVCTSMLMASNSDVQPLHEASRTPYRSRQ